MAVGLIPRILGGWLIVNGLGYLTNSFTGLLLPQHLAVVSKATFPFLLGEVAFMLWLLIMGARPRPLTRPPHRRRPDSRGCRCTGTYYQRTILGGPPVCWHSRPGRGRPRPAPVVIAHPHTREGAVPQSVPRAGAPRGRRDDDSPAAR